jgi:hypothetical protein
MFAARGIDPPALTDPRSLSAGTSSRPLAARRRFRTFGDLNRRPVDRRRVEDAFAGRLPTRNEACLGGPDESLFSRRRRMGSGRRP